MCGRSANAGAPARCAGRAGDYGGQGRDQQPEDDQRSLQQQRQVHSTRIFLAWQWLVRSPRGHHGALHPTSSVPSTSLVPAASAASTVSMAVPPRNLICPRGQAPQAWCWQRPSLYRHQQARDRATAGLVHTERPRAHAGFWTSEAGMSPRSPNV
jgi:hypothetical protein